MSASSALTLAVVLGLCGVVIVGVARLLQNLRVPDSRSILISFLLFGLATGILAVSLWPMDTSVYPNVPAALFGDWLYVAAIALIGDPHSDRAHYTIPWLLRVPQVYALASVLLCGAAGAAAQWLYNRRPGKSYGKNARRVAR